MFIRKKLLLCLVVCLLFAAGGCMPNIPTQDQPPVLNAVLDTTNGVVPLPSDLLKDPKTGLLAIPQAPTDSNLTKEIKASLNTLDGWLTSQTVTFPFDGLLDSTSVNAGSVKLFDITDLTAIVAYKSSDYYAFFNKSRTPPTAPPYNIYLKNKAPAAFSLPADFKMGHKYFVVIANTVKGKDAANPTVTEAQVTFFLKEKDSLVNDQGQSKTVLSDALANQLEPLRKYYNAIWTAVETANLAQRADSLAFMEFSVQSGPLPIFNPSQVATLMPSPIDLTSPANAPLSVKPFICFNAPIKPETAAAGIKFFKFTGIPATPLAPVAFTTNFPGTPDVAKCNGALKLEIVPSAPLSATSKYIIIMSDAIIGANGTKTAAFSYFSLIRDTNPLITGNNLNSPLIDNTLDVLILLGTDPSKATQADWDAAYATLITNLQGLETLRLAYNGQTGAGATDLFSIAQAVGVPRLSVTAMWVFSTGITP